MQSNLPEIQQQLNGFSTETLLIFSYDDYPSVYIGIENRQVKKDWIEALAKVIFEQDVDKVVSEEGVDQNEAANIDDLRDLVSKFQVKASEVTETVLPKVKVEKPELVEQKGTEKPQLKQYAVRPHEESKPNPTVPIQNKAIASKKEGGKYAEIGAGTGALIAIFMGAVIGVNIAGAIGVVIAWLFFSGIGAIIGSGIGTIIDKRKESGESAEISTEVGTIIGGFIGGFIGVGIRWDDTAAVRMLAVSIGFYLGAVIGRFIGKSRSK